jgi:hypothetical protein
MAILKADQLLICRMLSLYDLCFLDCKKCFFKYSFLSKAQDLEDAQRYQLILDMEREALKHLEFFTRKILMHLGSRNLSYKKLQYQYYN